MFLTRYRPSTSLDTIFDEFFPVYKKWPKEDEESDAFRLPMTNVNETDKEFVLTMEMPGVGKKNVNVAIEDNHIVITGEKIEKTESEGLLRREIRSETFRRSFLLDSNVDRENIKAKLDNGILKVTLPKRAESVGRRIDVD
ncbi:MAG: Hsp20/alpha crystallin family protein [Candidatus Krumholzibacteria bacterium]|nr:Hsp20/alpha crystallin family protein [Candidatus Krumholzibacteria bacterium]